MSAVPESDLPDSLRRPTPSDMRVSPEEQKRRDEDAAKIQLAEYLAKAKKLQENPNDVRLKQDVMALAKELEAKGSLVPTGDLPSATPSAPQPPAPAASSPIADAASKALGEASAQTGVAPGALAGGALGGALGVLEQKNLARPVTMVSEALSAAQGALSPPGGGG